MGQDLPLKPVTSVQRFDGRDLGQVPHIAVLGSCKLGNFVATLPLLRLLRRRYPNAQIDFWGSEATADFEHALCGDDQPLDWRISGTSQKLMAMGNSHWPPPSGQQQGVTWRSTATASTRSPRL